MNFCFRRDEAAVRPKHEFIPKTLADLHAEGLTSDDVNGASIFHVPLPSRPKNLNFAPPQSNYIPQSQGDSYLYNFHWEKGNEAATVLRYSDFLSFHLSFA